MSQPKYVLLRNDGLGVMIGPQYSMVRSIGNYTFFVSASVCLGIPWPVSLGIRPHFVGSRFSMVGRIENYSLLRSVPELCIAVLREGRLRGALQV